MVSTEEEPSSRSLKFKVANAISTEALSTAIGTLKFQKGWRACVHSCPYNNIKFYIFHIFCVYSGRWRKVRKTMAISIARIDLVKSNQKPSVVIGFNIK